MGWFDNIRDEIATSPSLLNLHQQIIEASVKEGLILYKRRFYLLATSALLSTILAGIHESAHEGVLKTLNRLKANFYWKGMNKSVKDFV